VYEKQAKTILLEKLGFGRCSLLIAHPENNELKEIKELNGKTIATTYPKILKDYLEKNKVEAKVIELSGSVEIAPSLGVADLICDIVSTGNTLMMNKLKKSFEVFKSEAVLISSDNLLKDSKKKGILDDLLKSVRFLKQGARNIL
jgi:ATP phosphoribosyltransferase